MAKQPTEKKTTADAEAPDTETAPAEKPSKGDSADVRKLRAELAIALERIKELEAPAPKKSGKQPLPAQYKGTKRYKLTVPCYRKGLLDAGAIISVTNEIPSKTWIEVDGNGKPVNQPEESEPEVAE